MSRKRGQSILEYVIVLTVIVVAIAIAANGVIKNAVTKALNDSSSTIQNATAQLPH